MGKKESFIKPYFSDVSYIILYVIFLTSCFQTELCESMRLILLSLVTTLKSVKIEEKSMAVGVQTIVARLVGGIPGPILYGYFIDNTCILWQQSNCGE